MSENVISIEGPVESRDGQLVLLIPLHAGGEVLAPLAKGIGAVEAEYLKIIIPSWLADKLGVSEGSLVVVDNKNGKFTITRSTAGSVKH